jgi:hypothetical protein
VALPTHFNTCLDWTINYSCLTLNLQIGVIDKVEITKSVQYTHIQLNCVLTSLFGFPPLRPPETSQLDPLNANSRQLLQLANLRNHFPLWFFLYNLKLAA